MANSMKYTLSSFDKKPDSDNTETKEALPPSTQYATSKINGGKSEERVYENEDWKQRKRSKCSARECKRISEGLVVDYGSKALRCKARRIQGPGGLKSLRAC